MDVDHAVHNDYRPIDVFSANNDDPLIIVTIKHVRVHGKRGECVVLTMSVSQLLIKV